MKTKITLAAGLTLVRGLEQTQRKSAQKAASGDSNLSPKKWQASGKQSFLHIVKSA